MFEEQTAHEVNVDIGRKGGETRIHAQRGSDEGSVILYLMFISDTQAHLHKHTEKHTQRYTSTRHTQTHTSKQRNKQIDRQTNRQTDRQINRQADKQK